MRLSEEQWRTCGIIVRLCLLDWALIHANIPRHKRQHTVHSNALRDFAAFQSAPYSPCEALDTVILQHTSECLRHIGVTSCERGGPPPSAPRTEQHVSVSPPQPAPRPPLLPTATQRGVNVKSDLILGGLNMKRGLCTFTTFGTNAMLIFQVCKPR